jgi:hypothetical protein
LLPFNKKVIEAISNKEIPSLYDEKFFERIDFRKFLENL